VLWWARPTPLAPAVLTVVAVLAPRPAAVLTALTLFSSVTHFSSKNSHHGDGGKHNVDLESTEGLTKSEKWLLGIEDDQPSVHGQQNQQNQRKIADNDSNLKSKLEESSCLLVMEPWWCLGCLLLCSTQPVLGSFVAFTHLGCLLLLLWMIICRFL